MIGLAPAAPRERQWRVTLPGVPAQVIAAACMEDAAKQAVYRWMGDGRLPYPKYGVVACRVSDVREPGLEILQIVSVRV